MDKLASLLSAVLGCPAESLSDDSKPEDVDGWDSLNHITIVMDVEEEFGIKFSTEEIVSIKSVGELRQLIDSKQVGK